MWALLMAIQMVVTTVMVKLPNAENAAFGIITREGAGPELDMLIFAGVLLLLFAGPGSLSIDRLLGIERDRHL
jgi:uncharacterized membrane protein YphA (DoxX/SURF4 family)